MAGGERFDVVQPHRHAAVLGRSAHATHADAEEAVRCAKEAAPAWQELSFDDRAAVFLKAADLLAGPWRQTLNAATMLGQSKTAFQAEIDSACELVDFWRWNVHFAREVLAKQPVSSSGVWNRVDHRPLEGFVYAITPFNFTAIAGNLPSAPALMGNTVVWKPSPTQQFSAHHLLRLLEAAGLLTVWSTCSPATGGRSPRSHWPIADLAGIDFTGTTPTFQHLWPTVGQNIAGYRGYPRLVGETGGKDFVVAHPSPTSTAAHRSRARRLRVPGPEVLGGVPGLRPPLGLDAAAGRLADWTESLPMGDVADFANFLGAVIDRRSFSSCPACWTG